MKEDPFISNILENIRCENALITAMIIVFLFSVVFILIFFGVTLIEFNQNNYQQCLMQYQTVEEAINQYQSRR